jgi:5-methylcytosine-specific restriction endonuclease McrA
MNSRAKIYKFYLTKGREKITQDVSADTIEKARKQLPPDYTITKEEVINLIAPKLKHAPMVYNNSIHNMQAVKKVASRLYEKPPIYISPVKEVTGYIYEASTDFLESTEWKELRYLALVKSNGKCSCCGSSPKDGVVLNVDHIKPRKLFPALALDINNLQVLCSDCNHGKGNHDQTNWRDLYDN